jgi:hypothetical protein
MRTFPGNRGGFKRRVQLGPFIRDMLVINGEMVPHDIYIAYKNEVQKEPSKDALTLARKRVRNALVKAKRERPHQRVKVTEEEIEAAYPVYLQGGVFIVGDKKIDWRPHALKGKKRVGSYNSFMHYIWLAKDLGLIEKTGNQAVAMGKSGSSSEQWHEEHLSETIRITSDGTSSDAWNNLWIAKYGERA